MDKGCKPNKIWVDQGGEFHNNLLKRFLRIIDIEMYSAYNEGKSVVAERFVRTSKNKIFKHMTALSKNVYFIVLNDIVEKYNNTVHRTIKMKLIDVTSHSYADYNEDSIISKIKNTVPWTFVISDSNGEEITGSFYEKELQKTSQEKFRIEEIIERKGNKLYIKWKGYDNSFNSWIDKKDIE